jgi:hypothetical protein
MLLTKFLPEIFLAMIDKHRKPSVTGHRHLCAGLVL